MTSQSHLEIPEFRPRRFLRGGHRQTLGSFFSPSPFTLPTPETRLIEVEPGIPVLCQCHWQENRSAAMTLIIVHGLEGSSGSGYVIGTTHKALAQGMNVVRMNQRNCGGTDHIAPTLYNSSLSGDVVTVSRHVIDNDRVRAVALVGFSMGGNLVLKAAGEWAKNPPPELRGVAAVCPALDLAASADALHEPANRLYEWYFLWKLGARLRKKAALFPAHFDPRRLHGVRTLRQFDDRITAFYCGFSGADDYYARAAASNVIQEISLPTLILHAANDPFIRITPESRAKIASNPNIVFFETADGGHCSFIGEGDHARWAETQVVNFMRRFADF